MSNGVKGVEVIDEGLPTISGGHFLPPADNLYDLGSVAFSWRNLHVQTLIYATSVAGNWSPSADDTYYLGTALLGWKGIHMPDTYIKDDVDKVLLRNNADDVYVDLWCKDVKPQGNIVMADGGGVNTGVVDGDYFTIGAVDNDTNTITELMRFVGAAVPYLTIGAPTGYAIKLDPTVNGIYFGDLSDSWDILLKYTLDYLYVRNSADTGWRSLTASVIGFYSSLTAKADALEIQAVNTDDNYIKFMARDSGVGRVEVARMAGAADPYFSMGGSQEFKFYYSGVATLGAITLAGGVTGGDQAFTDVGDMTFHDESVLCTGTASGDWFALSAYNTSAYKKAISIKGGIAAPMVVFNEESVDMDFMVYSDATQRIFTIWGDNGHIVIGDNTQSSMSADVYMHTNEAQTVAASDDHYRVYLHGGAALTVQTATTSDWIATLVLAEPNIALAGTGVVTSGVTLGILGAPTEGIANYSIYVYAGDCRFGGDILIDDTFGILTGLAVDDYFVIEAYDTTGSARQEMMRFANNAGTPGKLGFWGVTPVVQQTGTAVVTENYAGTGDLDTEAELAAAINANGAAINIIRTALNALGLTTTV